MTSNDEYVLELLQRNGVVSPEQAEHARGLAGTNGTTAVDQLVHEGYLRESEILNTIAAEFGMQIVSLQDVDIAPEIRELITAETARRYRIVPIAKQDNG